MLLPALEATGTKPESAIFIGGTTFDTEMAQAAKVATDRRRPGDTIRLIDGGRNVPIAHVVGDLRSYIRDVLEKDEAERAS